MREKITEKSGSTVPQAPKWLYPIVAIWLVFCAYALWWSLQQQLSWFVGDQQATEFLDVTEADQLLKQYLQEQPTVAEFEVFHFYRESCSCNMRVAAHVRELEQDKRHRVHQVNLDQVALPIELPATPAVLVRKASKGWIYFGPYGFGMLCQESNVNDWIQANRQQDNLPPLLNTLGKGCFCQEPGRASTAMLNQQNEIDGPLGALDKG